MLSIVQFEDIAGRPQIKLDLPGPLRIGDPIQLQGFRLERKTTEGRTEILEVPPSRFRVTAVGMDASRVPLRQLLSLESMSGVSPSWKAVKKTPRSRPRLSPAIFPKTPI